MNDKLSRRHFIGAGGGTAAALAFGSCTSRGSEDTAQRAASRPATPAANTRIKDPPAAPPPPPSEVLPRDSFMKYLDGRANFNMQRCHHCAQASFLTLQEAFGLPGEHILKALTPLPGIAERGETCGAVVGSLMALGLVFGRDNVEDDVAWRASLVPARAFCADFETAFGSTQCGDLQEKLFGKRYDLADPGERAEFIAAHPNPTEVCGRVVRTAARLAAEQILEKRKTS